ncbi:MAG: hypothetical protein ABIW19_07850 [Vicinamibacterales bacterium]
MTLSPPSAPEHKKRVLDGVQVYQREGFAEHARLSFDMRQLASGVLRKRRRLMALKRGEKTDEDDEQTGDCANTSLGVREVSSANSTDLTRIRKPESLDLA